MIECTHDVQKQLNYMLKCAHNGQKRFVKLMSVMSVFVSVGRVFSVRV